MAVVKPFHAYSPKQEFVLDVHCLPYDVLSYEDARQYGENNPKSFVHVTRSEIDLNLDKESDVYSEKVYHKAKENLNRLITENIYVRETEPCFFFFFQKTEKLSQCGLVCLISVDDYQNNVIKVHERTRNVKETDRINHIDILQADAEPVFCFFNPVDDVLTEIFFEIKKSAPDYHFTTKEGIENSLWKVNQHLDIDNITCYFASIPAIYIADGHHRAKAAFEVREKYKKSRSNWDKAEKSNFFLSVLFPAKQLNILAYNRVIKNVENIGIDEFKNILADDFIIKKIDKTELPDRNKIPQGKGEIGFYMEKNWYLLKLKNTDLAESHLDVEILQNRILEPYFKILNPRTDKNIAFIGGIYGENRLEELVDSGEWDLAFSMFPVRVDDIVNVAGQNKIMPPKSTWFEPKLTSGLFFYKFD